MADSLVDEISDNPELQLNEISMKVESNHGSSFILTGGFNEIQDDFLDMENSFDMIVNSFKDPYNGIDSPVQSFPTKILVPLSDASNASTDVETLNFPSLGALSLSKRFKDSQNCCFGPEDDISSSSHPTSLTSYRSADEIEAKLLESELSDNFASSNYDYKLPSELQGCGIRTITARTLNQVLLGHFKNHLKSFNIFDCRYPYEFQAGHIDGSINLFHLEETIRFLYNCPPSNANSNTDINFKESNYQFIPKFNSNHALILHCEFSVNRAPTLARSIRRFDRLINGHSYPTLHYPQIYVLQGGYKTFFENFATFHCRPANYQPMHDINFTQQLKYFRQLSKKKSQIHSIKNQLINSFACDKQIDESNLNSLKRSRSLKF